MNRSFLVLDIEAVPDERVWTPKEPGQFPPPYAWRPICIAAVNLQVVRTEDGKDDYLRVMRMGVIEPGVKDGFPEFVAEADRRERALLTTFGEVMRLRKPDLVTWNGRGYDVPVLMQRSLRYGIDQSWWYDNREYRYRYSEEGHCDLADAMADYGACRTVGLDGIAKLIGLPGKYGDINGAEVQAAYAQGRAEDIGSYCLSDAVQTTFCWMRWLLQTGRIGLSCYRASAAALVGICERNPRLAGFARGIDRQVLLLEHEQPEEEAPAPTEPVVERAS
jgi:3'-5' exonuclease